MTLRCLNLECKFQPKAWAEYKWVQRKENKLILEIPCRNTQPQRKGVAFFLFSYRAEESREAQRSAILSAVSAKWAFPRWILFSPEVILCSHVDCVDVYWGCRLAAAEAYPLSADYCSRYRLHQKVTLVQCCFSFYKGGESILEIEEFWPAARGSWKLPLCLLLSSCKNNRLIYSSSLESWPCVRTLSVLFFQDAK